MQEAMRFLEPVSQHERLIGEQLDGWSFGHQLAFIEDHHPRAQVDHQFQVVSRNEFGTRKCLEQGFEFTTPTRIQVTGRLIEHQHAGFAGQDSRQADSSLFAVAQPVRFPLLETLKPNLRQAMLDQRPQYRARQSQLAWTEGDILKNRGRNQLIVRILEE